MGKVLVTAKIENLEDLFCVEQGFLKADQVRWVHMAKAQVDTGATMLSLPKQIITRLGLQSFGTLRARTRTRSGPVMLRIYGVVQLTIQGRVWRGDVLEVSDDCPPLIGQLPLEGLDFVVDPQGQCLIGNPEHGGEQMVELY